MAYRVRIDKQACMSAGLCVLDGAEGFGFDDDELAEVLPGVTRLTDEQLRSIARSCPGQAIELLEQEGTSVNLFAD